jgi:hypothetical protein
VQAGQCRSCEKRPRFSTLPVFVPSLSRQNEQFELEKRLKNGSKRPRFSDLSIPSLSMLLSMPSTSTTASACEKNNTSQFKPSFKVCFVPSLSWQIVLLNERKSLAPPPPQRKRVRLRTAFAICKAEAMPPAAVLEFHSSTCSGNTLYAIPARYSN